jgi:uncharacterized cupredoxin-like copper-binding protein
MTRLHALCGLSRRRAVRTARRGRRVAAAAALLAATAALAGCSVRATADTPRRVVVTIHHSAFQPPRVTVRPEETVTFVLRNTDPIDHEFILGDEAVQQRHEKGTEAHHGAVPGEVSVPAGAEASTTYEFTLRRPLEFACHLPGHYAYGMRGLVVLSD